MVKSTIVDSKTGRSKDSNVRTSYGTFFRRRRYKVIRAIQKRIADYTFIPVEHGEGLEILHYGVGQKYESHFDYFVHEFNTRYGGQRMTTLFMYLLDVEESGETVFPAAKGNASSMVGISECVKKGHAVRPKMGDALFSVSSALCTSLLNRMRVSHQACQDILLAKRWMPKPEKMREEHLSKARRNFQKHKES